jgi:hypothetical protein
MSKNEREGRSFRRAESTLYMYMRSPPTPKLLNRQDVQPATLHNSSHRYDALPLKQFCRALIIQPINAILRNLQRELPAPVPHDCPPKALRLRRCRRILFLWIERICRRHRLRPLLLRPRDEVRAQNIRRRRKIRASCILRDCDHRGREQPQRDPQHGVSVHTHSEIAPASRFCANQIYLKTIRDFHTALALSEAGPLQREM